MVHRSIGRLAPASGDLRSEVGIVTGIGHALFGSDSGIDWLALGTDYRRIRKHIERVVPGFTDFEHRVSQAAGFELPNTARVRDFSAIGGRAHVTVNPVTAALAPEGHLLLQTLRSHDQFNTTVYGLNDRYRGIKAGRRVVFVNKTDLVALGLTDGEHVDIVSVWGDGERRAPRFRIVEYPCAPGSAAAYFPEANVLVPLDSAADTSNTPTSKSIVVRLERVD